MKKVLFLIFLFSPFLIVSQETDLPEQHIALDRATTLLNDGEYPEAEAAFREILESDTDNPDAVIGLGRAVIYQERFEEGYEIFSKAIESFDSPNAWFFRGYTGFKLGNRDQARQDYIESVTRGYDHLDAYFNIGYIYYMDRMYKEGEEWFRKALDRNQRFAPSWYYLGVCKYFQDFDAYYEFSKTIELDPDYVRAYVYRGILLDKIRSYERAIKDFAKAVELDPDYAWGYFYLGQDLERMKRSSEAVERLEKALDLGLSTAKVFNALAGSYWSLKEYDKAEDYFNKAVDQSPDSAWVYSNRGYFYKQNWHRKNYVKAIEDFKKAIDLEPEWAVPYNYLGFCYNVLEEYEEAIEVLREAVRLAPDWSWPWNNLGNALKHSGDTDEAIGSYQKSIECDPEYLYPHYNLGILYQDAKEYEKAVECYNKALELNPRHCDSYNNLGNALVSLKQYKEADEIFTKGLVINPDHLKLLRNRGKLYYSLGQPEKAVADLGRLLELDPDSAYCHKYLGKSYIKLGKVKEARFHIEKAIELDPYYSEELGSILDKLKGLEEYLPVYLFWGDEPVEGLDVTFIGLPKYETKHISDSFGSVLILRSRLTEGTEYYLYDGDYKNPDKDWEFSNTTFYYYDGLEEVRLQVKKKFSGISPADGELMHAVSPLLKWEFPKSVEWFRLTISRKTKELNNGIKTYTEFRRLDKIREAEYQIREVLPSNEYLWTVTAFSENDIPLYYLSSKFIIE